MVKYGYLLAFIGVSAIIAFFYFKGQRDCETKQIIQEKKEQVIIYETIIKEKKAVNKRRNDALLVNSDDNILWLEENLCEDCR